MYSFLEHIEPNPRAVKLLVNAFGVNVAVARCGGLINDTLEIWDQIALWTILALRFPLLADHLARYPMHVEVFKQISSDIVLDEHQQVLDTISKPILEALALKEVQALIHGMNIIGADGKVRITPLTYGILARIVGQLAW